MANFYKFIVIRGLLCLSICTVLTNSSCAQVVSLTIWSDSLLTSVGSTFTNRLIITNTGSQKQDIFISVQTPKSIQLVSSLPEQLEILPRDTVIIPIKGLVNHQANSPVEQISIQMIDKIGRILESKSFRVFMKGKDRAAISLYTPEETLVLFTNAESARLPLRLVHNHARKTTFFIDVISIPIGMDRAAFPLTVELKPNQDTTLSIIVNPLRHWAINNPYQLVVTIRDEQKSIVGNVMYKLVVAVAVKQFSNTITEPGGGYGASVALSSLNNDQWGKEIRVWGSDSIGKAHLDFNLNYVNFGTDHYQQLQNSFVSLNTNHVMARVGSIYDFHELPLFGRGLKAAISQADHQWTFWAINSTQNWLSADSNLWNGNTFSVRYDQQLHKWAGSSYSLSSNYYTQSNTMRAGYLNFASFRYEQPERHSLQVLGGQSVEFARNSSSRAQTFGWAGQLNYTYQSPKMSWQLRSYISNPFYSGIQKGALLLYSQLYWKPSAKTALVARINHLQYDRASFSSPVDYYRHVFGNTVAEINVNYQLGQTTVTLRPYWYSQSDYSNPYSQRADANRLATSLSYRRRPDQHITINYDVGTFYDRTSLSPHSSFLSQRLTSSISMGLFSFWAYLQKGPYYLFDLRGDNPAKFATTSLTPTVNFSLFDRKLFGSIGVTYLHDAYVNKSRYIASGRVQYDVTPNLSVNLLGNGTPYNQEPESAYSLYRLQVTKLFKPIKARQRNQLQFSFFEDINGNKEKDSGEQWLDGLLVSVNENTLLTDAKGSIVYRNLPTGLYAISVVSTGRPGDPVLYHEDINMTAGGSIKKVIALARTFKVSGHIRCQANAYDRQPCQFNRFIIDIEQESRKISSIIPLPDGSFTVHLAPGPYTLLVRDTGREPQATVKTVPLTLTETGQYPTLNWVVDGATRPIEIKRFKQR